MVKGRLRWRDGSGRVGAGGELRGDAVADLTGEGDRGGAIAPSKRPAEKIGDTKF